MSILITRTAMTDDDGTGTTGTIINNAWKTQVYDQIDAALAETVEPGTVPELNGVQFPATQVPSANANVLDDYEEGAWTPVLGGAGGESGQSYTSRVGRYIKIGRQVTASCLVQLSAKGTITGAVMLKGLPFTSENVSNAYAAPSVSYFEALATNWIALGGYLAPNATAIDITGRQSAGADHVALTTSDIGNSSVLVVTVTYFATA
jgi:hypothetical protein